MIDAGVLALDVLQDGLSPFDLPHGRFGARHHIGFPVITGEEITTPWAHLNAYPLKEVVDPEMTPYEIIRAAHRQGAVVHWNHPGSTSPWEIERADGRLAEGGIDGWEHLPAAYDRWKATGKLPALLGTTDTHSGIFSYPERTAFLAAAPTGDALAETVRRGNTVLVNPTKLHITYGPDALTGTIWAALAEGQALKQAHTERLREFLQHADLYGLLKDLRTQ